MIPRGVEAEEDFGPCGISEADALGADGDTPIGADLDSGAHAPNIRPPRAARRGAQDRTFLQPGQIPGALRGLPEFTVRFLGVVVPPQCVDVRVGVGQFSDLLAGEIGWEALLPELPAPHRSVRFFCGRGMGMTVLQRPMADLGAVEFEGVEAQDFRSGEAVGARRRAG